MAWSSALHVVRRPGLLGPALVSALFLLPSPPRPRTSICSSSPASAATRSTRRSSTSGRRRSSTRRRSTGSLTTSITYLGERTELDPARIKLRSTRENVTEAFADLAKRAKVNDEIIVLLIGHGTFDGKIGGVQPAGPGPDRGRLRDAPRDDSRRSGSPSSTPAARAAPSSRSLAGPARTIVAATNTGGERNETRFPRVLRRGARQRRGGPRSQRPRVDPRSVRLRQEPGRRVVRKGRPHPDRARDARRRQRGQAGVDAVPGAAAIAHGGDGEQPIRSCARWSSSATRSSARSPSCGCARTRWTRPSTSSSSRSWSPTWP